MSIGSYDFVFITETWLNDQVTNSMIDPFHQYHVIRRDCTTKIGGGCTALISNNFKLVEYEFNQDEHKLMNHCECDILCFDVLISNAKQRFILIYRPPSSTKIELQIAKTQSFVALLTKLVDSHATTFILGDLNLPKIDWSTLSSINDGIHNVVFDFLCDYGFSQFVAEPTRLSNNVDSVGNI